MNEDYLEELHNLSIEELRNSGVPYYILDMYPDITLPIYPEEIINF